MSQKSADIIHNAAVALSLEPQEQPQQQPQQQSQQQPQQS
jgi:hypothetical protein